MYLTLCTLDFVASGDFFFKINFIRKLFHEHYGLYPDQDRRSVGTDLGLNCLPRLLADNRSRRLQGKR